MKTILLLTLFSVSIFAAPAQPAGTSTSAPADLAALERFLALPDDELAQMASAIARVREMTPAQRAALREEIAAFRHLPDSQRAQIRQGWGGMPAEIQDGWREMMQSATAEERAAIQSKMRSLPPEEKAKYRRSLVETYLKAKAHRP